LKWGEQYKGNQYALPSYDEMMEGILDWYLYRLNNYIDEMSLQQQNVLIKKARKHFYEL